MSIYLGLGSNLGDRADHLRRAITLLEASGLEILRVSPVVESPALLPHGAPPEWDLPFLNLALECRTRLEPHALASRIGEIERALGRAGTARWSPRPIDVDILLWGDRTVSDERLVIPHRDLARRAFVLAPLIALAPRLAVPGLGGETLLERSIALGQQIPLWMGILNVTPDSFSDGGRYLEWSAIEAHLDAMLAGGVHIIDVGGQSTRPAAALVTADEEWERIAPVLRELARRFAGERLRPLVSVDTFRPEVAARALAEGADIINDVTGLGDERMLDLARSSSADWIVMHSLGIPADAAMLPLDCDPVAALEHWLERKLDAWSAAGLDLERLIFDSGIGFAKNGLQSTRLLRAAGSFRRYGLRVLVGHSRKSFLRNVTQHYRDERDLATLGASLQLAAQGVDILRVHDVPAHVAAYRGWSHVRG